MAGMTETTYKNRKSYFIYEGVGENVQPGLKEYCSKQGFIPVFVEHHDAAMEAYSKIAHCVGLIATGAAGAADSARIHDFARLSGVTSLIASEGDDLVQVTESILAALFPEKLKELCSFSVNKIVPMLVPGLSLNWTDVTSSQEAFVSDFLVSVETLADHFMGSVGVRGKLTRLRENNPFFNQMTDDEILSFFAEVGNEVLGVINFNLLKAKIAAQVTLPVMVKETDGAGFRRRSSFYLPSFSLKEGSSDLVINFQFLVPFLKDAKFDRGLDFQVGFAQEANVELF